MIGLAVQVVLILLPVFWAIGARTRLGRLRRLVREAYLPLEHLLCERHDRLCALAVDVAPALREEAEMINALTAACEQAGVAAAAARVQPTDAPLMQAVNEAERTVNQGFAPLLRAIEARPRIARDREVRRQRADVQAAAANTAFARERFNEAMNAYNQAVTEVPTHVLAWCFRMRPGVVLQGGPPLARKEAAVSADAAGGSAAVAGLAGAALAGGAVTNTLEALRAAHPSVPEEAWAPTQIAHD